MRGGRWVLLARLGVVVALVTLAASQFSYAVLGSTSMEPWASSGALVVSRPVPAADVEVGDVVTVGVPGRGLVTHRVVELGEPAGDGVTARLQGDRNDLPDAVPVELTGEVAVAIASIPVLGQVLHVAGPMVGVAAALLAFGAAALALTRGDGTSDTHDVAVDDHATGLDPRIEALLATCEQLADDGIAPVVLGDLVRVRVAAVLGLPGIEDAVASEGLGDGVRFYVVALADADPDALRLVPPGSARRTAGSVAVDSWWDEVVGDVPPAVRVATADVTA